MITNQNKNTRETYKKPTYQASLQVNLNSGFKDFLSWAPSIQNTFRVFIDQGLMLGDITIFHSDIAYLKENYKISGTDCSVSRISSEISFLVSEGYVLKKKGAFRKANTYSLPPKGLSLAKVVASQKSLSVSTGNSKRRKKNIKNSTCSRECASVFKVNNPKQYKRFNVHSGALPVIQRKLKVTSRGIAGYYCFDDDSLWALKEREDLHKKDKVKEQRTFCKEHMRLRGLLPDIDIVYRSWRKIDAENNGVRMPMFCLKDMFVDFKHAFLTGVSWYRKKGDRNLPFSDAFSKSFKEKKNCAQRKETMPIRDIGYVPGSIRSKELDEVYKNAGKWKVIKTDRRSLFSLSH